MRPSRPPCFYWLLLPLSLSAHSIQVSAAMLLLHSRACPEGSSHIAVSFSVRALPQVSPVRVIRHVAPDVALTLSAAQPPCLPSQYSVFPDSFDVDLRPPPHRGQGRALDPQGLEL